MLNFLNKKNNYDFIHQFQWISGSNKPRLKALYVDNINNNIVGKTNLIYPTYYSLLLLLNQKPFVKTTKDSIASFKIRPSMNLGGFVTINKNSCFWPKLFYLINPSLSRCNKSYQYSGKSYNIHCNYGVENLVSTMSAPQEKNSVNFNKIGGLNLIFNFRSPTKQVPFYYLP